jgi:Putative Ig domain
MNFGPITCFPAIAIFLGSLLAAQTQPLAQPLAIVNRPLPPIEAGVEFHILLRATGGVPPYVWSVASGDLPEGITLTPEGLLSGRPAKAGAFTVTLKVEDSGHPTHSINKELHAVVTASLLLEWLDPPKVHDNRIDGSVQVSNGSKDTFDLTVVIVAVAANGRATAIGYEHFPLKPDTSNLKITFGDTLPPDGYVVHADAIAEIPERQTILRRQLQTPQPLQVTQGP